MSRMKLRKTVILVMMFINLACVPLLLVFLYAMSLKKEDALEKAEMMRAEAISCFAALDDIKSVFDRNDIADSGDS